MSRLTIVSSPHRIHGLFAALAIAAWLASPSANANDARGIAVTGPSATQTGDFAVQPGHALLIGASHYSSGRWIDLITVPDELKLVGDALRRQGFQVRTETDLPSARLIEVIRDYIATYGSDRSNRLVFYFSGHGYSRDNGNRGYFVPVDSPFPGDDEIGFLKKAVDMNQVVSWARQLEANHALFVFDSCFSGTLFMQRGSGDSMLIQKLSAAPVREFITAGSAGETVPARSDFALAFAQALNDGLADANHDGYTTGTELGVYLQSRIAALGHQTPWYGKIPDTALAQGDFIFRSGRPATHEPPERLVATLVVTSTPEGASVFLDGQLTGITPVTLEDTAPGHHRLEIRADGYDPARTEIEVASGDNRRLRATLNRRQQVARLSVTTTPADARVTFSDTGQRYESNMELPEGDYKLRVTAPGYSTRDVLVTMRDSDTNLFVDLSPQPVRVAQRGDYDEPYRGSQAGAVYAPAPRAPTCFSHNTLGAAFWWSAPDPYLAQAGAIRACQMNTPPGAFCQVTNCQ